ncbi:glycerol-3-phosphate dehydrogenase [NAD+] [Halteromyces radiatus]|uniref:glycerol-3-phosphate dehydrogenase [NAD+] n=1 Tax=Halteromyces radiatus TaxID=101107 RepID=UPI00221EA693|nr:glycerol-3-phosphate dehydrogenase [NAD+] [Halteromyces radiatus]KAI8097662.1 glycerol-3-phosphate dehydrogenase [NAD+] [Halteromyces radiatus]
MYKTRITFSYFKPFLYRSFSSSFSSSSFTSSTMTLKKERVCIIGSGNWGTTIAKIIGENVQRHNQLFEQEIRQWVFEEDYQGQPLTRVINTTRENPKYLAGIRLPDNIIAEPDLIKACRDATVLVFVLPHQFVRGVCDDLVTSSFSPDTKAISLIKGLDIKPNGITLFSEEIGRRLHLKDVAVLSGANIASEVAQEHFCETTIGSRADGQLFYQLFNTPYFRVNVIRDYVGVELCGALKNVVAVAAGISDGLDYGSNTKAALIRIGLMEMRKFGKSFFGGVEDNTFFESCGVADLMTTCSGGRNRKVAEAFARTGKPMDVLEKELLNGQKLQGVLTAAEVYQFLTARKMNHEFPLFDAVYRIIYQGAPLDTLIKL